MFVSYKSKKALKIFQIEMIEIFDYILNFVIEGKKNTDVD